MTTTFFFSFFLCVLLCISFIQMRFAPAILTIFVWWRIHFLFDKFLIAKLFFCLIPLLHSVHLRAVKALLNRTAIKEEVKTASLQAIFWDLCRKLWIFSIKQKIITMLSSGQIFDSNYGFDSLFERNFIEKRHVKPFCYFCMWTFCLVCKHLT